MTRVGASWVSPVPGIADLPALCANIVRHSQHLRVREERIAEFTHRLLQGASLITTLDPEVHYAGPTPEDTARYVLALDSINFGCGLFRYEALARGLARAFRAQCLHTPEAWATATPEGLASFLPAPPVLLKEFVHSLRASADHLMPYKGQVLKLVAACSGRADSLADTLGTWRNFHDVARHRGQDIPFLKRAQIFAADLALALPELRLQNVDGLTCFADNQVPHVLRQDGLLDYATGLAERIDRGHFLVTGSVEEVEIRAAAVHVVERIRDEARRQGLAVTAMNIDHLLWHRGEGAAYRATPAHRTRTTAY